MHNISTIYCNFRREICKYSSRAVIVTVPSEAALAQFTKLNAVPPKDPAKYVLRLLSVFFTDEELAESNYESQGNESIESGHNICYKR